jgi:hypothetical protein
MAAKKATETTNVYATIYEGSFDVNFDCVGVMVCRFALCHCMPPTEDDECTFRECGSCRSKVAQQAALEALRKRITKELKQIEEDLEG